MPKILALPVFSSDAISSVGYATEEILLALVIAGTGIITGTPVSLILAIAIIVLLWMVATSYRQTIFAYPSGGGSYIVAKENLGTIPGLTAGASLMIDYVLTVAVSASSGVAAILSFVPDWQPYRVPIILGVVAFITLANLRGVRESGALFALPTYTFIASALGVIALALLQFVRNPAFTIAPPPANTIPHSEPHTGLLLYFLILKAFASGCSAMTGTEAISNGVQAFKPPESRNAAMTLTMMATILTTIFVGVGYIAWRAKVVPMSQTAPGYQTVLSQIATAAVGRNWLYYIFQGATAGILMIAANTSFAGFPRLASIMARDRFVPRQFYNLGDKLVYSNGIVVLALAAALLVVIFKGLVNALIPLYAIGVFMSFTLSQAGMVVHFRKLKEPGWRLHSMISGAGALLTAVVALVQAVTKFHEGAWIVLILIPVFVLGFLEVHRHYIALGNKLRLTPEDKFVQMNNTVLVLTPSLHRGVLPALEYAKGLSGDVRAIHVETDPLDTVLLEERWDTWGGGIPLIVLESPYRSLLGPLLDYLEEAKRERPNYVITVIISEFVPRKWWEKLLHNQSGLMLKIALLFRRDIITTNVRYYLD